MINFLCYHGYRLQEMVREVYGERSRLRKHMVDMDTRERETLLRVCRKVCVRMCVRMCVCVCVCVCVRLCVHVCGSTVTDSILLSLYHAYTIH